MAGGSTCVIQVAELDSRHRSFICVATVAFASFSSSCHHTDTLIRNANPVIQHLIGTQIVSQGAYAGGSLARRNSCRIAHDLSLHVLDDTRDDGGILARGINNSFIKIEIKWENVHWRQVGEGWYDAWLSGTSAVFEWNPPKSQKGPMKILGWRVKQLAMHFFMEPPGPPLGAPLHPQNLPNATCYFLSDQAK